MKSVSSWNSEGSSTFGRLGLKGLFDIFTPTLFTSGLIRFGGPQKGFSPSSLVSFLITHFDIILCLHLSSLTL